MQKYVSSTNAVSLIQTGSTPSFRHRCRPLKTIMTPSIGQQPVDRPSGPRGSTNTIGNRSWRPTISRGMIRGQFCSLDLTSSDNVERNVNTYTFGKVPSLDAAGSSWCLVLEVGRSLALSGKLGRRWWGSVVGASEQPKSKRNCMVEISISLITKRPGQPG